MMIQYACLTQSQAEKQAIMNEVDQIVEDGIEMFVGQCQSMILKAEAPFMPMSFTLWR